MKKVLANNILDCSECGEFQKDLIEVGYKNPYTDNLFAFVCLDCLRKAMELLTKE